MIQSQNRTRGAPFGPNETIEILTVDIKGITVLLNVHDRTREGEDATCLITLYLKRPNKTE